MSKIDQLEQDIFDKDTKIAMLSAEIERQAQKLKNKDAELAGLRDSVAELEQRANAVPGLEHELGELGNAHRGLDGEYAKQQEQLRAANEEVQHQIAEKSNLEAKAAMLTTEIERMQYKLKAR